MDLYIFNPINYQTILHESNVYMTNCAAPLTWLVSMCIVIHSEKSQINVILQQKLPAAKLSAVCTVYKQ